jgi:PKD repeat protein
VDPAGGDFALQAGSPAIDSADSSVANWPATDAAGRARVDDPATPNTGAGPVPYADRGALEFPALGVPLAALTATPASGEAPLAVTFDASGSSDPDGGTIVSYLFNFGDGTAPVQQQAPTATHTYAGAGTFTATVTVRDDEGGTASTSKVITVSGNQAPNGTIDSPASNVTIVAGQSVSFNGTGTDPDGHPLTFLWNFGGGAPNQEVEDPGPVVFNAPGTYTVTFTVTDSLASADPTPDSRVITVTAATTSNLVGNPSFESDTSGWKAYGSATIQRIAGGVDGAFALEVRGPASTSQFGIDDSPSWVATTPAAGTRYRFTAWVRSEQNSGEARLRVREYPSGTQVGVTTRSAPVVLSPAWQMLTVDYVAQAAGSRLDVHVLDYVPVTTSEVFQVDTIAIHIIP